MACRFLDGFDYYSTGDLPRKWNSAGAQATVDKTVFRNGLGACRLQAASPGGRISKTLDAQASWVVGFGFRVSSLGTVSKEWRLAFTDSSTI